VVVNGKKRYAFLVTHSLLLCRLPSKSDPSCLYKLYRTLDPTNCAYADVPNTDDIQVHVGSPPRVYVVTFRKPEVKREWLRSLEEMKVNVAELKRSSSTTKVSESRARKPPSTSQSPRKSVGAAAAGSAPDKRRKLASTQQSVTKKDPEAKVLASLLSKLKKELAEETQARLMVEEHNQVMERILKEQQKQNSVEMVDETSLQEFALRAESLSSSVDKLTAENIALTAQADSLKMELICLRLERGQPIEDLLGAPDADLSEDESDSEE
jgi:hypothetical protein